MKRLSVLPLVVLLSVAPRAGGPPGIGEGANLLENGGFDAGLDGWNAWGGVRDLIGKDGAGSLLVRNETPKWSGADQILYLPDDVAEVEVSAWVRTSLVVPGKESWEAARVAAEFLDATGVLTGGYPPPVGVLSGSAPWTEVRRTFRPPEGARRIKVQCALGNAAGSAWFDSVAVTFRDESGRPLQAAVPSGPFDHGTWYPLPAGSATGNFVDWSGLLDAPAGNHGWLRSTPDGRFRFEDGTPARFWGVNLVASQVFAERSSSDSLAERLARLGANMVRLHHMDAAWSHPNIFGNASGTLGLDPRSMDRLDYLVAALRRKGIYVFLDFLVHREFAVSDSVLPGAGQGAKQAALFSPRLIALQARYAKALMEHYNPYTGRAWKDEPAVAMAEFVNESSIFTHFDGDVLAPAYRAELDSLWRAAGHAGDLPRFSLDWSGLRPKLKGPDGAGDAEAAIRFLAGLERATYDTLRAAVRSTGAKLQLAGTNFPPPILATLRNNASQDFVITNDYWDHPQVWKLGNDWSRIDQAPLDDASQLLSPKSNLVATRAWARVADKPFVVTEWNHCHPNEYELEGAPLLAAYASLQDWSGVLQFDYEREALGSRPIKRYTLSTSPAMLAQWAVAAPLFLRSDVRPADTGWTETVGADKSMRLPSYSWWEERAWQTPYLGRVAKRFDSLSREPDAPAVGAGELLSSTGELAYDPKIGTLRVNAPRVQGAVGFVGGRDWSFPRIAFHLENEHASVLAVSADGADLADSKLFYVAAVGPVKGTGLEFVRSRNGIARVGGLPLLAQVLEGNLAVRGLDTSEAVLFTALAPDGSRGEPVVSRDGRFDLSQGRALVYEARIVPKPPEPTPPAPEVSPESAPEGTFPVDGAPSTVPAAGDSGAAPERIPASETTP